MEICVTNTLAPIQTSLLTNTQVFSRIHRVWSMDLGPCITVVEFMYSAHVERHVLMMGANMFGIRTPNMLADIDSICCTDMLKMNTQHVLAVSSNMTTKHVGRYVCHMDLNMLTMNLWHIAATCGPTCMRQQSQHVGDRIPWRCVCQHVHYTWIPLSLCWTSVCVHGTWTGRWHCRLRSSTKKIRFLHQWNSPTMHSKPARYAWSHTTTQRSAHTWETGTLKKTTTAQSHKIRYKIKTHQKPSILKRKNRHRFQFHSLPLNPNHVIWFNHTNRKRK